MDPTRSRSGSKTLRTGTGTQYLYRQMSTIRYPFIIKQCFSLKYVLATPLQICGGMSKFGTYPVYNFNNTCALKIQKKFFRQW